MLSQSASKPKFEKIANFPKSARNPTCKACKSILEAFCKSFKRLLQETLQDFCKTFKLLKYLQKSFLANVNAPLDLERLEEFELETCPGDFSVRSFAKV